MGAAVRVPLSPPVIRWALDHSNASADAILDKFDVSAWLSGEGAPTMRQLEAFAKSTGVPFGYLLLDEPPELKLPIPDFRAGTGQPQAQPSADLLAVLHQSIQRQDWYREFAESHDVPRASFAGSASSWTSQAAAASMREALKFEVTQRTGSWEQTRKKLVRRFEELGGLCVVTSIVGNNTRRQLDIDEFRGFALADTSVPLVFVNAAQSLNGQIFTLAHEFAHVWHGESGISLEDMRIDPNSDVEKWCNATASEFLVPSSDLRDRFSALPNASITEKLDALASVYKCGTLVVLQALRRCKLLTGLNFQEIYTSEEERLRQLNEGQKSSGGDFYNNQPFRAGERLSRAVIRDTREGKTPFTEALSLLSFGSVNVFDDYASKLGA